MAYTNKQWRESHVTEGQFTSYSGLSIQYYRKFSEGSCIMLMVYCGFWKFHEMAEYYWLAG